MERKQKFKNLEHLERRDTDLYKEYQKLDLQKKFRYDYIISQLSAKFYMTADNAMRIIQRKRRETEDKENTPTLFS